jgi:hypothetical protein
MASSIAKYAPSVFESKNPVLLNRLALLTQLACLHSPEEMVEKCNYVFLFLNFCHHRSVFDMFATFLSFSGGEKTLKLRLQFKAWDLPDRILRIIRDAESALPQDPMDTTVAMLAAIFRLIPHVRADNNLGFPLAAPDAIAVLAREFVDPPVAFLNAQWEALQSCVIDLNANVLSAKVGMMLDLLQPRERRFFAFQSAILRILPNIIEVDPVATAELAARKFPEALCDIIRRFPDHGIVHGEVNEFVSVLMTVNSQFAREVVLAILPVVADAMRSDSVILRAFAWNFRKMIEKLNPRFEIVRFTLEKMQEEPGFAKNFEDLDTLIQTPFGGELPTHNPPVADPSRSMFTPQQLIELLRQSQITRR